jgi:hypothetical protein
MSAIDNRFFKNTYVTGEGRQNYTRIGILEDPLFTSFTFDIDYMSSPLFYTISGDVYEYPNTIGMCEKIEDKLEYMNLKNQDGYDILPLFSASFDGGEKMGFGLQKNVYTDLPLYGATEYIYMVDKRNGGINQNDVRYDNNNSHVVDFDVNGSNSYKLGDSIKELVSESDKKWADKQKEQYDEIADECYDILNDVNVQNDHLQNESAYIDAESEFKNCTVDVDGEDLNEVQLLDKIKECEDIQNNFDNLKKDISNSINDYLKRLQSEGLNAYKNNTYVQEICKNYGTAGAVNNNMQTIYNNLDSKFKNENPNHPQKDTNGWFINEYFIRGRNTYSTAFRTLHTELKGISKNVDEITGDYDNITKDESIKIIETTTDDTKNLIYFLFNEESISGMGIIKPYKESLKELGLYNESNNTLNGEIRIYNKNSKFEIFNTIPDWVDKMEVAINYFTGDSTTVRDIYGEVYKMAMLVMSSYCDETCFDENFTSDKIKKSIENIPKYKNALNELNKKLYGRDESGNARDKNNPSSDSKYGKYLEAKNKLENDDYSLAEKEKKLAESGYGLNKLIKEYDDEYKLRRDNPYFSEPNSDIKNFFKEEGETEPEINSRPPQTVLDMLGFISGMKKMTKNYPYIIQGVTGLDVAYNKHYGIKDPYLGSGEDKITLTCLESLDLRVSSMFNRYFNAIYDRQYRRERVPVNLRRFNCSIYVHDVRNFVSNLRYDNNIISSENRIFELRDMYYSVIEFRFYDCEIISEETGNIFNDISNEAPSDMKKTNFTFTYGNCVVNFVPNERKYSEQKPLDTIAGVKLKEPDPNATIKPPENVTIEEKRKRQPGPLPPIEEIPTVKPPILETVEPPKVEPPKEVTIKPPKEVTNKQQSNKNKSGTNRTSARSTTNRTSARSTGGGRKKGGGSWYEGGVTLRSNGKGRVRSYTYNKKGKLK